MEDERKGKPSASGMERLALCPGSWNLEKTMPPQEENEHMKLGTDIHSVLAGEKDFEILTVEGQEIATLCLSEFSEMIEGLNLGERTKEVIEERFWYGEEFSGEVDRIDFFGDETAVITDFKTGRVSQSNAAENYQLRAYVVLVKASFPKLKRIFSTIIQPLAGGITIAEYEKDDIHAATDEIKGILFDAKEANALRIPSEDACKWCRAKEVCPDRNEKIVSYYTEITSLTGAIVSNLTNAGLVKIDDKSSLVEDFIESVKKEIKVRLMAGQLVRGRTLGKGRETRSIVDASSAAAALSGVVSSSDFWLCAKISVASLEKIFAKNKGIKGKESKEALSKALGWNLETKQGDPIVIRSK